MEYKTTEVKSRQYKRVYNEKKYISFPRGSQVLLPGPMDRFPGYGRVVCASVSQDSMHLNMLRNCNTAWHLVSIQ